MASTHIMFATLQLIEFPAGANLSQFYKANNSSAVEMRAFWTSIHTNRAGKCHDEAGANSTGV